MSQRQPRCTYDDRGRPRSVQPADRCGYVQGLLVALVVLVVAQSRLGPSWSATTSTTERLFPSSAYQDRCASRPNGR